MDKRPVIEARNLTRVFDGGAAKVQAVQGVSLSVRRGEFVALVGPSGCGKSTLLSMLGLIEQPTSGEVILEGHSVSGTSEAELQNRRRTTIGYVFQAFNLLSTLSVEENVMLPCLLTGATEGAARERAADGREELAVDHVDVEGEPREHAPERRRTPCRRSLWRTAGSPRATLGVVPK